MNNLEKQLLKLPKPKLGARADLKIKLRLYVLIISKNIGKFFSLLKPKNYILRNALIAFMVIAIIFSGTSIYAYSNNQIIPGHGLYALKRAIENAEQGLSYFNNNSRVNVYEKFSERRFNEALNLSQESLDGQNKTQTSRYIQKNIAEAMENIGAAISAADKIKDAAEAQRIKTRIRQRGEAEIQYLETIENNATEIEDNEVAEKAHEAQTTIGRYGDTIKNNEEKNSDNYNSTDADSETKDDQSTDSQYRPRQGTAINENNPPQTINDAEPQTNQPSTNEDTEKLGDNSSGDQTETNNESDQYERPDTERNDEDGNERDDEGEETDSENRDR